MKIKHLFIECNNEIVDLRLRIIFDVKVCPKGCPAEISLTENIAFVQDH